MTNKMSDRFIYTEKDASGCILQPPNYAHCEDCLFHNEQRPNTCLVYREVKPSPIIYDGKTCDKKRTE